MTNALSSVVHYGPCCNARCEVLLSLQTQTMASMWANRKVAEMQPIVDDAGQPLFGIRRNLDGHPCKNGPCAERDVHKLAFLNLVNQYFPKSMQWGKGRCEGPCVSSNNNANSARSSC